MISSTRNNFSQSGFTLLELLVVMAIIAVMAGIGLMSFTSAQSRARDATRKRDLANIASALETYYNDYDAYPLSDGSGRIMGCMDGVTECNWGQAWIANDVTYMVELPRGAQAGDDYFYGSDATGSKYWLFSLIENDDDRSKGVARDTNDEFSYYTYSGSHVPLQGISTGCNGSVCNYGIASSNTTVAEEFDIFE